MTIEIIIVAIGALVIGFLAASLISRQKLAAAVVDLKLAQSNSEQITQKFATLEAEHIGLGKQHRTLELSNNTVLAEQSALSKMHSDLEQQNKQSVEKLSLEMANRHQAETDKQAAVTELVENKKAQESLNARLTECQAQLDAERNNVTAEKERNADLDKFAKGEQVKAQETEIKYQEQKTQLEALQTKHDELSEKYNLISKQHSELKTALEERNSSHSHLNTQLTSLQDKFDTLQTKYNEASNAYTELKTALEERNNSHAQQNEQLKTLQDKLDSLQEKHTAISNEHTELKTSLGEREKNHLQQIEQFEQQKIALTNEFTNLANKIFEEKNRSFTDTNKVSIDAMLQPFKEQIDGFQKRVNDIHDASIKGNEGISNQIKNVLDIGLKMSKEATNLASALKGDSQQRGAWGEAQLERTLEMSGLVEKTHFEKQSAFKDLDGNQKKTDYLIKLPDNKHMIIDSKVSLVAYDKAISAETPELQNLALVEHVNAVKKHIDDLASKDYTNLVGVHSPSFVLMFMPIEPAYIDALKSNKDLFSYGYSKNIVLVSHTTLIPILRTVANLWMMHSSNTEAREISEKAAEIYNQVCTVAERLQKLGNTLNTVKNQYNETVTSLVGQQGLHGKVERFNKLSNKVSKSMPAIQPQHIDFETERLLLAAEPIIEENTNNHSNTTDLIEEAN